MKKFEEEYAKAHCVSRRHLGIQEIEVAKITGSVGRYQDFDQAFRLQNAQSAMRLRMIESAMLTGKELPPIEVYKIRDEYFVVDGNHRVAASRRLGRKMIKARVIEYLPAQETRADRVVWERSAFDLRTGLTWIELTEVGRYPKLLEEIENYRKYLAERFGGSFTLKEAAEDWVAMIYLPVVERIQSDGLLEQFPRRTSADLFMYIVDHQQRAARQKGKELTLVEALEDFEKRHPVKPLGEKIRDLFSRQVVSTETCRECDLCVENCPHGALVKHEGHYHRLEKCEDCGVCRDLCPSQAIHKVEDCDKNEEERGRVGEEDAVDSVDAHDGFGGELGT